MILKKKAPSPARVEALDRREAAVHEAGHVVIARHVGADVLWAYITRTSNPGPDEKTWIGQARIERLEGRRRVMIGVAGAVAEYVWNGERDDLRDEEGWWDTAIMSPTDWLDAGVGPGDEPFGITRGPGAAAFFRTINKVIHLLEGPLRAELFATSRRLIVASRWTTSRAPRRHRHRDRQGARANAASCAPSTRDGAAARRRDRRGGVTGEFSKLASLGRSGEFRTLLADSGRFLGAPAPSLGRPQVEFRTRFALRLAFIRASRPVCIGAPPGKDPRGYRRHKASAGSFPAVIDGRWPSRWPGGAPRFRRVR